MVAMLAGWPVSFFGDIFGATAGVESLLTPAKGDCRPGRRDGGHGKDDDDQRAREIDQRPKRKGEVLEKKKEKGWALAGGPTRYSAGPT